MTDLSVNAHVISDGFLGELPTKILRHGPSGAQVEIAIKGATVLSWHAPFRGKLGSFLAGFETQEAFESQSGMRNAIMFPFANRLAGDQYTWDRVTYQVPKQYKFDPEVIHGFVRVADWEVGAAELDNPNYVAQTFSYSIKSEQHAWYPFDLEVAVRFELNATDLSVTLSYRNVGTSSAPASSGWHPYFQVPEHDTFDDLRLSVPGRVQIKMDDKLIPLAGEDAYQQLSAHVVHDPLAGVEYDDAWDGLLADGDGISRTTLTEPNTGAGLVVWQERGTVLVFTGSEDPAPRASIAIEPVESTTNAFNRPDREKDVRLDPGAERVFKFGASVIDK